nr:MAG TPA: hypothetical protein [Caudoviricetes sp.]
MIIRAIMSINLALQLCFTSESAAALRRGSTSRCSHFLRFMLSHTTDGARAHGSGREAYQTGRGCALSLA